MPHSQIISNVVMNGPDGTIATLNRKDETAELETDPDPPVLPEPRHHHEGSDDNDSDDDYAATSRHLEQKQTMSSSFFSGGPSTSCRVDLPVMMTSHASERGGGVIAAQQDGSSGSMTVGSLEQTPLDLSLESDDISHDDNSDAQMVSSGAKVAEDTKVTGGNSDLVPSAKERDSEPPAEVSEWHFFKPSSGSTLPSPGRQPEALPVENLKTTRVGSKCSRDGTKAKTTKNSRKKSPKETIVSGSTDKSQVATKPPCKKSRLAGGQNEVPTVSHSTTCQPFRDKDSSANMPISYIDLTLEDSENSPECIDHHFIPNNDHQVRTLNNDHHGIGPIVISSCDTEQEDGTTVLKEGSPDILPPTPGREQVESILQRKHLSVL